MKNLGKLQALYNRTLKNCYYYESMGNKAALLNEIGVLRGIAYCIEEITSESLDHYIVWDDFKEMIEKQQELKIVLDETYRAAVK